MIKLEKIVKLLASNDVEFVIVGGVAGNIHGSSQVTYDIDLCYARDANNLNRLAQVLAPLHPRLRGAPSGLPFRWDAETLLRGLNFTLQTDLGDVDLLGEVAGIGTFDQVRKVSVSISLYGLEIQILSLEALIAAKRAAGRPKDLLILPELEALREVTDHSDL